MNAWKYTLLLFFLKFVFNVNSELCRESVNSELSRESVEDLLYMLTSV